MFDVRVPAAGSTDAEHVGVPEDIESVHCGLTWTDVG